MKTTILISCKALIKIVKELQRQLRRRSFGKYTLADIEVSYSTPFNF